jgi:hypothetical protein
MAAAWTGHTEVAAYLLKKTKDPQSLLMERNRDGCSPLWFAAAHGKLSMIKLLLRKGADMLLGDQDGYPPSKVARLRNHEDCADVLEVGEHGPVLDAPDTACLLAGGDPPPSLTCLVCPRPRGPRMRREPTSSSGNGASSTTSAR